MQGNAVSKPVEKCRIADARRVKIEGMGVRNREIFAREFAQKAATPPQISM
jgi:hypothetical protein